MNYRKETIRISERKRKGPERNQKPIRSSMSRPTLSLLMAALLFTSPSASTTNRNSDNGPERTIRYWAAEAMSPTAEITAAATAAVIRRNVISGAAIFTVGDAAAQMIATRSKQNKTPILINARTTSTTAPTAESKATIHSGRKSNSLATAFSNLDINRLYSSSVLGAIWSGFCVPFIYGTVEKTFPGKANLRQILVKVLVTCSILSTIGNYATMFARRFAAQYTAYQFDKSSSLRLKWFSKPIESMLLFLAIFKGCFKSCNRDIMEVIVDDLKIWPLYDLTCYSIIPPNWRPITTSIMSSGWAMYMSVVSAKTEQDEEEKDDSPVAPFVAPVCTIKPLLEVEPKPQTIQVTPLDPVPIIKAVRSETTKRLIGVTGGDASRKLIPPPLEPSNSNSDGNDEDIARKNP